MQVVKDLDSIYDFIGLNLNRILGELKSLGFAVNFLAKYLPKLEKGK